MDAKIITEDGVTLDATAECVAGQHFVDVHLTDAVSVYLALQPAEARGFAARLVAAADACDAAAAKPAGRA